MVKAFDIISLSGTFEATWRGVDGAVGAGMILETQRRTRQNSPIYPLMQSMFYGTKLVPGLYQVLVTSLKMPETKHPKTEDRKDQRPERANIQSRQEPKSL